MDGAIIYQIYYHDDQRKELFPFTKPYKNEVLTPFFENSVIKDIVHGTQFEKIGVCSWRLKEKLRRNIPPYRNFDESLLKSDYDVLSLSKNTKKHVMLACAETNHKGFKVLLNKIGDKISQPIPNEVKYPIYYNHFVARTEIYKQYIKEFLLPAMEVMETDTEVKQLCYVDSGYSKLTKEPMSAQAAVQLGVNYFPLHPFLCERFFSCWINNKNFNVQYI